MRRTPILTALVALLALPSVASADDASADAAELFKQGRAALAKKDYETACARLAASLQLERAVGTLISLAQCETATHKLAGAREHWQEAADLADATHDRLKRGPYARKMFEEIDPRVPRLTVRLSTGAPHDSTIKRDGIELPAATLGTPLPVDPGTHAVDAVAPRHEIRRVEVELKEGESKAVEVEPGADIRLTEPAPPPPIPPAGVTPAPAIARTVPPALDAMKPQLSTPLSSGGDTQRVTGLVVGATGIVGMGIGSFFGLNASAKWSQAKSDCGAGCAPASSAQSERGDAQSAATLSTIAFIGGGAALVGGFVLYFTAPRGGDASVTATPTVGPSTAGIVLHGGF